MMSLWRAFWGLIARPGSRAFGLLPEVWVEGLRLTVLCLESVPFEGEDLPCPDNKQNREVRRRPRDGRAGEAD